ncbi:MAG: hypothetical protein WBK91_05420 [Alphaproteobacteria bacterium]
MCLAAPPAHAEKKEGEEPKKAKEKKPVTHPPNEGAPKARETDGGDKVYVSIGPIILPVVTDDGPQQIITMIVSLQVEDIEGSDKVRQQLPRLVDAYMRALYGRLDRNTMHHGRIVNIDFIKRMVGRATDEILGKGIVEDVLIQAIAQRPV